MDFPYQDPGQVSYFWCIGLNPWDTAGVEIHGGIDIVPNYDSSATEIQRFPLVAVAKGRIIIIHVDATGHGCPSVTLVLELNPYWFVIYTIEPQTEDSTEFAEQMNSIYVDEGRLVKRGKRLADLIVATVKPGAYPHLHFGLLYKNPAESWEYVYSHYLEILRSDGTNLPPDEGPKSPWSPMDLGLPTTLFVLTSISAGKRVRLWIASQRLPQMVTIAQVSALMAQPMVTVAVQRNSGRLPEAGYKIANIESIGSIAAWHGRTTVLACRCVARW